MKPLVLSSKAVFLSVRCHKLLLTDYIGRTRADYQARQLPFDSIILYRAGGSVSFEAIRFLATQNIPLIHLNWDGDRTSVTLPPAPISGQLRLAQYQTFLSEPRRNRLAAAFVKEKVSKSIALLKFLKHRYPEIDLIPIKSVLKTVPLMLFEGKAAEAYWIEFGKVINSTQPRFEFVGRKSGSNNVGAADRTNSLLNYCYAILVAKIRVAIQKASLDPEVGFLHLPQPNSTPLVYDVEELFRWLADLTVIELVESRAITPDDFLFNSDYKVFLKENAAHRVVERLSQNFNRSVKIGNRNLKYESILDLDLRRLVKFVQAGQPAIDFSCPFAADFSKVDSYLADRILELPTEERKKLGISKTTLWYARKHVREGKPIRVYAKTRWKLGGPRPNPVHRAY